jgi:hypothetical protein
MIIGGGVDVRNVAESAAAFGIDVELEEEVFEVWPENWLAVVVFYRSTTQWTVGFGGPVGLRYEAIETVMRLIDVPEGDRLSVFDGVRVMESEALRYFAERRER